MTPLNVSRLWFKKSSLALLGFVENTNCASRLFCFTITGMMAASFVNNFSNGRGGRIVPASNAPQVGLAAAILFSLSNVFLNRLSSKREKFQVNFVKPL